MYLEVGDSRVAPVPFHPEPDLQMQIYLQMRWRRSEVGWTLLRMVYFTLYVLLHTVSCQSFSVRYTVLIQYCLLRLT